MLDQDPNTKETTADSQHWKKYSGSPMVVRKYFLCIADDI
jgi:hypothetical protein